MNVEEEAAGVVHLAAMIVGGKKSNSGLHLDVMTALMNVEEEAAGVVHLAAMIVDLTVGMTAGMIVGMIEDRCVVTTAVTTDEMTVEKNAAVVEEAGGVDLVMTVDHLCVGMIVVMTAGMTAGMTEVDSDEEEATVTAVA